MSFIHYSLLRERCGFQNGSNFFIFHHIRFRSTILNVGMHMENFSPLQQKYDATEPFQDFVIVTILSSVYIQNPGDYWPLYFDLVLRTMT